MMKQGRTVKKGGREEEGREDKKKGAAVKKDR